MFVFVFVLFHRLFRKISKDLDGNRRFEKANISYLGR